jgi:hypothetical protein
VRHAKNSLGIADFVSSSGRREPGERATFALLSVALATALLFDFTNGCHDSAEDVANVIQTVVLRHT